MLGGDFGTAAKYFERNLRLPFTPPLVAVFGPSLFYSNILYNFSISIKHFIIMVYDASSAAFSFVPGCETYIDSYCSMVF